MYLGGESNPYLKIRNFPFYPLNYQGIHALIKLCKVTHYSRILQIQVSTLSFETHKKHPLFTFKSNESI